MLQTAPHCYGQYVASSDCTGCTYGKSCEYYTASARGIDRGFRLVSVERMNERGKAVIDPAPLPGEEQKQNNPVIRYRDLELFLRYLMELDDAALQLVREIISSGNGDPCTVVKLGKALGISRQAAHKKVFRVIGRHPELNRMLCSLLSRMPPRKAA